MEMLVRFSLTVDFPKPWVNEHIKHIRYVKKVVTEFVEELQIMLIDILYFILHIHKDDSI